MNWNDYEAIWKRQPLPLGSAADLAALKQTFEEKRRKLAATLWVRDLAEASAGVFVSAAFIYIAWHQPKVAWPIAIAVALVLGVTVFFVRERIRTHRQKLGLDAPLLAQLEAEIAELQHQRRLLLGIWAWYLAPCAAATFILCATIYANRQPWERELFLLVLAGFGLLVALALWFVWILNRRAVRQQIEPRLAELEKLHRDLLSPS